MGGHQEIFALAVNGTYRLGAAASPISLYVIAGLGGYGIANFHPGCELRFCDATNRVGGNLGLGANLAVFHVRGFVEVRYHALTFDTVHASYVPVTVGLRF